MDRLTSSEVRSKVQLASIDEQLLPHDWGHNQSWGFSMRAAAVPPLSGTTFDEENPMPKVEPFHTRRKEDFRNAPVWHDNDQCNEGKKIVLEDRVDWEQGYHCWICDGLNKSERERRNIV